MCKFFTSSTAAVSWLCSTWENNVVGHYFLQVLGQQRAGSQMMKFWPIAKGGRARAAYQKTESPRNSWWAGALPILDVMLQRHYAPSLYCKADLPASFSAVTLQLQGYLCPNHEFENNEFTKYIKIIPALNVVFKKAIPKYDLNTKWHFSLTPNFMITKLHVKYNS